MKNYLVFIATILFSTSCYARSEIIPLKIISANAITQFNVEIAKTTEQQALGLMFRTHLAINHGMLFVYQQPVQLNFWMKNTYIPLDILFINKQRKISSIQTMQPCHTQHCKIYSSTQPVQYALEINAGLAKKYRIKPGDRVYFTYR